MRLAARRRSRGFEPAVRQPDPGERWVKARSLTHHPGVPVGALAHMQTLKRANDTL